MEYPKMLNATLSCMDQIWKLDLCFATVDAYSPSDVPSYILTLQVLTLPSYLLISPDDLKQNILLAFRKYFLEWLAINFWQVLHLYPGDQGRDLIHVIGQIF